MRKGTIGLMMFAGVIACLVPRAAYAGEESAPQAAFMVDWSGPGHLTVTDDGITVVIENADEEVGGLIASEDAVAFFVAEGVIVPVVSQQIVAIGDDGQYVFGPEQVPIEATFSGEMSVQQMGHNLQVEVVFDEESAEGTGHDIFRAAFALEDPQPAMESTWSENSGNEFDGDHGNVDDCPGGSCHCDGTNGRSADVCCPAGKTPICNCSPEGCCTGRCIRDSKALGGEFEMTP